MNKQELISEQQSNLTFSDAANLLQQNSILENHDLLNQSLIDLNENTLIMEEPEIELQPIRTSIFYLPPDILENPSEEILIDVKKELEFYKDNYESAAKDVNECIKTANKSLKELSIPTENIINGIYELKDHYENTTKELCYPLFAEKEGLNTIQVSENNKENLEKDKKIVMDEIDKFYEDTKILNDCNYNILFNRILKSVKILSDLIKQIPNPIHDIMDKVEVSFSVFERILESFDNLEDPNKFHEIILVLKKRLKELFDDITKLKTDLNKKINILKNQYTSEYFGFEKLQSQVNQRINNLNVQSKIITNDIKNLREKYKNISINLPLIEINPLSINNLSQSIDSSFKLLTDKQESINDILTLVEDSFNSTLLKTTLDLLIIIDITGSMEQYMNEVREKLKENIDNIQKKCPGLEINFGFIGYKDFFDLNKGCSYVDIDLTLEYNLIKKKLDNVKVGGGGDTAEDVAGAIEMALKKSWKSNAKYAVLVSDAPCHGKKYHNNEVDDFPNGDPKNRDIEKMIAKLANNNVSLCCMRLTEKNDIMYGIFKKIYEKTKNYKKKFTFDIVGLNSAHDLSKKIVESCSKIYKNYRWIK